MSGNCMHLGNCIHLGNCVELGESIGSAECPEDCEIFREILAFLAKHDLTLGELLEAIEICKNIDTIVEKWELFGIDFGDILQIFDICSSMDAELTKPTRIYLETMAEAQKSVTGRFKAGSKVKKPALRNVKAVKKAGRRAKKS